MLVTPAPADTPHPWESLQPAFQSVQFWNALLWHWLRVHPDHRRRQQG